MAKLAYGDDLEVSMKVAMLRTFEHDSILRDLFVGKRPFKRSEPG